MRKIFLILLTIIFLLTPFCIKTKVFSESETIEKLNEENKKIKSKILEINEKKISLKTQYDFLEKKLGQLFIEKKIFLEKKKETQEKLEEKIGKKTDIEIFSEISEDEISKFILKLHREEKKISSKGEENFIKLFLLEIGVQKFFEDLKIFKKIEKINEKIFQNYELISKKNNEEIENISELKKEISQLNNKILLNSKELIEIKNAKEALFKFYSKQGNLFNKKLEENKKIMLLSLLETKKALLEQKKINEKINKKINTGYEKIKELKNSENIFAQSETIEGKTDPYEINGFENLDDKKFIWPVNKDRGITAYFLDPEYKKRIGVEHYGIDIRAKQGTKIKAPANAFVYKIHNGGMGYSYIILAHKGSIQTVYGHISKSLIKEGDIVLKGQVFALTGGLPGTPGAGNLTTGPHLHFEFHKNGKPVNPLDFFN